MQRGHAGSLVPLGLGKPRRRVCGHPLRLGLPHLQVGQFRILRVFAGVQIVCQALEALTALLLDGDPLGLIIGDALQVGEVAQQLGEIACPKHQLQKRLRGAAIAVLGRRRTAQGLAAFDDLLLRFEHLVRRFVYLRLEPLHLLTYLLALRNQLGHAGLGPVQRGRGVVDRALGGVGPFVGMGRAGKRAGEGNREHQGEDADRKARGKVFSRRHAPSPSSRTSGERRSSCTPPSAEARSAIRYPSSVR